MAAITQSPSSEVGVPVLTQYKLHVASLISKASNLTPEQTIQLVEERFDDDYDLSVAMMKIKKFKVEGDPSQIAVEWQSKVRPVFTLPLGPGKLSSHYHTYTDH